ncbi:hypothetical protein EG68_02539 [Paragonimus skrjabini miyazakii]|uniref:Doublecortin domain-containing protein n=1 Tax=Paragonimus skrjabini miyazakii TaxID=59628 RepID=A0A8S9Z3C6_9TREM|nr:hypothetical protein EG68_02539 [Paragonimus skrjabini miyazakii]
MIQPKVYTVMVFANGDLDNHCTIAAKTIEEVLQKGTYMLALNSAARRIFLPSGEEIYSFKQTNNIHHMFISCGESFKDPRKQLKETEAVRDGCRWSLSGVQLPDNRPSRATKVVLSKRFRSLNDRYRKRILTFQNGNSTEPYEIRADSNGFNSYLQACTMRFQLGAPVKRVFAWDGREISDFSDIPTFNSATDRGRKTAKHRDGNEQQRYLGPVWVSKGESYSPSGVYDYLGHCIGAMREKLEPLKSYKKQLEAAKEGNRNEVKQMKILSMSSNEQTKELELLLEQISASAAKVKPNGPAGGIAIKRLFNESGQEVFELKHLSNGDIVFISYGEGWITPKDYFLSCQFLQILRSRDGKIVTKEMPPDVFKSNTWSCADEKLTVDDELEPIPINESWSERELDENLEYNDTRERNSDDDQLSLRNFTILQSKEHAELFSVPLVITTTKQPDHDSAKPAATQIWSVNKQGQIRPQPCFGGLTLGLIFKADQVFGLVDRNFQTPNKPNKKQLTGFRVTLVPQNDDDAYQHWRFGVDGFIHNQGDEDLVLTCLYGSFPKRLRVLRNGDSNSSHAVYVTGPNVTNLQKVHQSPAKHNRDRSKKEQKCVDDEKSSKQRDPKLHCTGTTVSDFEFNVFLDRCSSTLRLTSAARRLFDEEGMEHFSLQKLPRDALVHVSSGGPFVNVWHAKQEQKLREFFVSLKPIVDRADNYVRLLKNMEQEWVLTVVPRLVDGAIVKLQRAAPGILTNTEAKLIQENYSDPTDTNETIKQTAHERACHASDLRYAETTVRRESKETDKAMDAVETESSKPISLLQPNREYFQRFEFSADGVLYPQADPTLALTMITSVYDKPRLLLKKRRFGEESQRFVLLKEGGIGCGEYVLSFELSDGANTTSLAGSIVAMSRPVTARFGRATQMFQYDLQSKLIYALATNLLDQKITASNISNICTHSVFSTSIEQPGFQISMVTTRDMGRRSQLSGKHPLNCATVCIACSRHLLGRFKLTPVHSGDSFVCAFANVRESTVKEMGSLSLFHGGYLDLSTYEAKWSVKYWQTRIDVDMNDLARMKRAHTELMTIVQGKPKMESVKLLVYRNGDARVLAPKLCVGSSMSGGILPDLKKEEREEEHLSKWPTKHALDNESLPTVKLISGGDIFQVGELEGPGKIKEYEFVIRIDDVYGLLEFLPGCLLTVNEELRLVLILVYEIFGHEVRSDVFEPNSSKLDDVTEIRIRSRLGPLKSYFSKVCPTLTIKLHPVLNWQDKTGSTFSSDLKLGQPIANCVVSMESLLILRDEADIRLSDIRAQFCRLWLLKEQLHSPRQMLYADTDSSKSTDKSADCGITVYTYLIEKSCETHQSENISSSIDIDLHGRRVDVSKDQHTAVESKGDIEEIDWSIMPIEVWASSGEAFVQLSDVYNDVDHVRMRAQEATMNHTCNRDNSSLSNNIPEDRDVTGATKHSRHGSVREANINPIRSNLYNQPLLKRIFVYKNQETPSGSVLVWGESLDAILEEARVKLNCQKMPEKLCTLDGEEVVRLTDLKQDQLVCLVCSGERFVSNGMHRFEIKANWTRARKTYGSGSTEMVVQSRENPLVGVDPFDSTNTNLHNRENLLSDLKRINVYENGKPIRTAQPITGDSLNQLLERSTILLRLPQTAVCFYTRDGMKITAFQQILHEDILAVSTTGQGFLSTRIHETY